MAIRWTSETNRAYLYERTNNMTSGPYSFADPTFARVLTLQCARRIEARFGNTN